MADKLSFIQLKALEHVKNKSEKLNNKSRLVTENIFKNNQIDLSIIEKVLINIQFNSQVIIHFHPDRLNKSSISVAESEFIKINLQQVSRMVDLLLLEVDKEIFGKKVYLVVYINKLVLIYLKDQNMALLI